MGFINIHWILIFVHFVVEVIHEIKYVFNKVQFLITFLSKRVIVHDLTYPWNCDFDETIVSVERDTWATSLTWAAIARTLSDLWSHIQKYQDNPME